MDTYYGICYNYVVTSDWQLLKGGGGCMGMSDKQYDGFLIDNIEDWDDVIELLETKEYDKALALAQRKREKNKNKLESPNSNN